MRQDLLELSEEQLDHEAERSYNCSCQLVELSTNSQQVSLGEDDPLIKDVCLVQALSCFSSSLLWEQVQAATHHHVLVEIIKQETEGIVQKQLRLVTMVGEERSVADHLLYRHATDLKGSLDIIHNLQGPVPADMGVPSVVSIALILDNSGTLLH